MYKENDAYGFFLKFKRTLKTSKNDLNNKKKRVKNISDASVDRDDLEI